jgi:hypothetical protein
MELGVWCMTLFTCSLTLTLAWSRYLRYNGRVIVQVGNSIYTVLYKSALSRSQIISQASGEERASKPSDYRRYSLFIHNLGDFDGDTNIV